MVWGTHVTAVLFILASPGFVTFPANINPDIGLSEV